MFAWLVLVNGVVLSGVWDLLFDEVGRESFGVAYVRPPFAGDACDLREPGCFVGFLGAGLVQGL